MRTIVALFLWPVFIARALIIATRTAFRLAKKQNKSIICRGCAQPTSAEDALWGHCSLECLAETNNALEDITDEIGKNTADWVALYDDDSGNTMSTFTIFFDEDGLMYLQDFSDEDAVLLKTIGYDGYSL